MFWCCKLSTRRSPKLEDTHSIFIKDMVIQMAIGVFDEEKERTQRVRVNVAACLIDYPDEKSDNILDTLSYDVIVQHVNHIADAGHIHLVETFATRIADAVLPEKNVKSVTVRVEKLDIYNFAIAGTEIYRAR
jgi:7,8-dihydroneopterin aldolase/epimerase/oxygenase